MMQVNFSPFMEAEVERRQSELRREMEQIRLAEAVTGNGTSTMQASGKVLARLGKSLVLLGSSLEQRSGQKSTIATSLQSQNSSKGCS